MSPCPDWCQFKNDAPHEVHGLIVFEGPPSAALLLTDENGAFPAGIIRFGYYVDGRHRWVEARTTLAADFGNILASLKVQDVGDFAAALVRAHDLLDVEEFEVVSDPHFPAGDITEGGDR